MEEQKQKLINDLFAIRAGMSYIVELYKQTQKTKESAYESKSKLKKDLCANMIANGISSTQIEIKEFNNDDLLDDLLWNGVFLKISTDVKLGVKAYSLEIEIYPNANLHPDISADFKDKLLQIDTLWRDSAKNGYLTYWDLCSQFGFGRYVCEDMQCDRQNVISDSGYATGHFEFNLGKIENENNYNEYVKFLNDALTFLKDKRRGMVFAFKAKKLYDKLIENFEKCKTAAPELKRQCKEIADKCAEEVTKNIGLAKNVYAAFVNEYSKFLDPRDWKNIDLLIYYLQTGRADSIKEALQLSDRQEQADAIVQALREINTTLRVGLNAINNTIIACTDRIVANQQIILSQGALQNALLANASVSSKQLDVTVHTVAG